MGTWTSGVDNFRFRELDVFWEISGDEGAPLRIVVGFVLRNGVDSSSGKKSSRSSSPSPCCWLACA